MAANTLPIFPKLTKNFGQTFVNADGTAYKTLFTAGAEGAIIDLISAISDDTAARHLVLNYFNGATGFDLGENPLAIGAGTDGATKAVNILNAVDLPWLANRADNSIVLQSGHSLRAKMKVAVTAAKTVTVFGAFGDY